MKTMEIFEPAMCCPTGICGLSVDVINIKEMTINVT